MKNWILVIGISTTLFGCASVTTYPIVWKTLPEFSVDYDYAWNEVVDVITDKNIQLHVLQKDAGYIESSTMPWGGRNFVLVVKFTSKSPVNFKLLVMGTVYDAFNGMNYQTGIPDLEKQLLDEIEGRLRSYKIGKPAQKYEFDTKIHFADEAKLKKIKQLYDDGLITQEEYEKERKEALDSM